ncbi:MAG: CPBP family intramembrane metalloprotease [Calditrichaeota bacterium]|nr:MAG: CPBP family intramembrane metalloprotease [Calditrichota bacterium]
MNVSSPVRKIIHFPLTKIIIGIVGLALVMSAGQYVTHKTLADTTLNPDVVNLIVGLVSAVLTIWAYRVLFRFYEKRSVTELSTRGMFKNLATGMVIGALLQSLTIAVIYLSGGYRIMDVHPVYFLIPPLTMGLTSAIMEEILVRGIIFRILEEKMGSYIALGISALLFGFMHLANPNSSLWVAAGLVIQAGLLLGMAYIYSRSLWLPIAIHFAWNFTQSAIFGARVSGLEISRTLITSRISGPAWLTGGGFGPEGSVQATLFSLIVTSILFVLSKRQGRIIAPVWKKEQPVAE